MLSRSAGLIALVIVGGQACIEQRSFTPLSPSVPQLLLPNNGDYLGFSPSGRRPRFSWAPSDSPLPAVQYELQYADEPSFGADTSTIRLSALSFQPDRELPVSTVAPVGSKYFWRVRACHSEGCSEYSKARSVFVGRSIQDLNGDGYSDIAIGAPGTTSGIGRAYVYFGGSGAAFDSSPDATLTDTKVGGTFGEAISAALDFDGDGYSDLVVGAPNYGPTGSSGVAYLYFGGPGTSFESTPDIIFSTGASGDRFGEAVSTAGDMNGDGFSDLVIGAAHNDSIGIDTGRAYVFLGGVSEGRDVPKAVLNGLPTSVLFGHRVSAISDVNIDGYSDIIIDEVVYDERNGVQNCISRIFNGGEQEISATSAMGIRRATTIKCFPRSNSAGDFNGDGIVDIANSVYTLNSGTINIYFSATPFDDSPDVTLEEPAAVTELTAGRDVNNDGRPDIGFLVGNSSTSDVRIALAAAATNDFSAPVTLVPQVDGKSKIAFVPDLNGDGVDDIVVGIPDDANGNGIGHVKVYFGSQAGDLDMQHDGLLMEAGAIRFGAAVAMP